jgi:hypothetical protein
MGVIALAIRFSSDQGLVEERLLTDDSGRSMTVFAFACDGPLGDFLRRNSLDGLPALYELVIWPHNCSN